MVQIARLREKALLQFIIKDLQHFSHAFGFMEKTAIGGFLPDWTIECHLSVRCEDLGLNSGARPGDIDVLLIPVFDGDRFVERSMAIEVKRFHVPKRNRGRSPSEYGSTQARGLVDHGFAFVGLLHIPIVERSDPQDWAEIPVQKMRYREGESRFEGTVSIDPAAHALTNRHVGRFETFELPDFVGYNVHTLQLDPDGQQIVGWSVWLAGSCEKSPSRR